MDVRSFFGRRRLPSRYRPRRARRVVRARISSGLTRPAAKAVAKIAKRVVKRSAETKYVAENYSEAPVSLYGSTVPTGGSPQLFTVIPAVAQGDGESYMRDGDKISPTKHVVDLDLRFNNTITDVSGASHLDECAWDITAHVWYGYVRKYKNGVDTLANAASLLQELLDDGAGNNIPWDGSAYINLFKTNTEVFTGLKHKKIRMFRPLGQQNAASVAGGMTTYFPQTIRKSLRLAFKPPKTLLYDEADQIPQNYAPVVIIGYQHNDNTQAANTTAGSKSVLNLPALIMGMRMHMWFKDI